MALSFAAKLYLAAAGMALLVAAGYGLTAQGPVPGVLLVTFALAAITGGIAIGAGAGRDPLPVVGPDDPPLSASATTAGSPARGSWYPPLLAAGLAVLAVGAATDVGVLLVGVVASLLVSVAWFAQLWREHPTFRGSVRLRVADRLVTPAGLPAAVFVLVAAIAIAFSRILLTVNEKASVVVALIGAIVVLGTFFVLSLARNVARTALSLLTVIAVVVLGAAGILGANRGERHFEAAPGAAPAPVVLTAERVAFSVTDIKVAANGEVNVRFVNRDRGTYHNFAVYQSADGTTQGLPVYNGKPINGGEVLNTFKAPAAGTYIFACDFHANMRGTFTVQ